MSAFISSLFAKFTTSPVIFELTAEQGKLKFHVHKDVLISQSEPFRNATTGSWSEATERKINLDDWDGETVGRLVEFLYTGNYQYPDPDSVSSGKPVPEDSSQQDLIGPRTTQEPSSLGPNRPLTPLNQCLNNFLPQNRDDRQTDEMRLKRFNSQDDYKGALLSHAKVYCLAHYKCIEALQTLALERLFILLLKVNPIQPDSPAALNFIGLVEYVYSNTDSLVSSEEPLRKVISQFAALNLEALQSREEMEELMSGGGDFVNELMPKVCRRLAVTAKILKSEAKKKAPVPAPPPAPPPRRTERNPIIRSFNTTEVHHWTDPWSKTSKVAFFGTTYSAPPGLPVGINIMDISKGGGIRIITYASNVGTDRFRIHIDSWRETKLYSAGCSWLQISNYDPDFQFGRFCTLEDHLHPQTLTSRLITFPRAYAAPPTVVVWLAGLDMEHSRFWRVKTYVTNVTTTNFIIHIDTWDNTILYSATSTWVAYAAGTPRVASGSFNTRDVRPLHPAQLETSGHVNFGHNIFSTTPHALLAFNELDIPCLRNLRIRVDYSSMTTAGMNWHISGWENSVVYCAGASYIALA